MMLMWNEAMNVVIKKCLVHCKIRLVTFPSPVGLSLTKLSLGGNNLNIFAQSDIWIGTGMSLTSFLQCIAHLGASQYNVIPLVHGGIQSQGLQSRAHC